MRLAKQFLFASLFFWVAGAVASMLDSWLATAPTSRHEFETWGSKLAILLCFIGSLTFLVCFTQFVAAPIGRFLFRPQQKDGP